MLPGNTDYGAQDTSRGPHPGPWPRGHHLPLHLLPHFHRVQGEGHQVGEAGSRPRSEALLQQAGGVLQTKITN